MSKLTLRILDKAEEDMDLAVILHKIILLLQQIF